MESPEWLTFLPYYLETGRWAYDIMRGLHRGNVLLVVALVLFGAGPAIAAQGTPVSTEQATTVGQHDVQTFDQSDEQATNASSNTTTEDIVSEARNEYEDLDSFEVAIQQRATAENETRNVSATMYYGADGQYRVEYSAPDSQAGNVVVLNDDRMVSYNATSNEAYVMNISSEWSDTSYSDDTEVGYFGQLGSTLNHSNVTYEGTAMVDGQEAYVLHLSPSDDSGSFDYSSERTLYLDTDTYLPVKRVATTEYGNQSVSSTTWYDFETDTSFTEETFTYDIPEDATVTHAFDNSSGENETTAPDSGESDSADETDGDDSSEAAPECGDQGTASEGDTASGDSA